MEKEKEFVFRFTMSVTAEEEAEALQYAINDLNEALKEGTLEYERLEGQTVTSVKQWEK